MANNSHEAEDALSLLQSQSTPYSHDKYADFVFKLLHCKGKKGDYYITCLEEQTNLHNNCQRIYSGGY